MPQPANLRRLDAHAHFFMPGFVAGLPDSCRRIQPDEVTLYAAFAAQHQIDGVLAVGYEGQPWATGNNAYIAELAATRDWLWPVAFIAEPAAMTAVHLEKLSIAGFVGISLYLFDGLESQLSQVDSSVWRWLDEQDWLISVNASGDTWLAWQPILAAHPGLRVIPAHLGLPPSHSTAPTIDAAKKLLEPMLSLAAYSNVHIKLSGLYAMTEPAYAYPHTPAWPYVAILIDAFGTDRLLWGSDFSPALEHISFAQSVAVVEHLPGLSADEMQAIWDGNLRKLLAPHAAARRLQ